MSRAALLLGTLVLILLVGEGVARLMATRKAGSAASAQARPDLPVLKDVLDIAKPNVRGLYQGVLHRTNSQGVRGPEYSEWPAAGSFRILLAGDSVTMGWAVEEPLAYPQVLERLLHESDASGRRYEVVNLGIAGVNARFSTRRLLRFAELYHPDLVIYGFTLNDIEGPAYRTLPKQDRKALSQQTWRRALRFNDSPSYLLRELWPRWIMVLEWSVFHPPEAERIAPQAAEWRKNYFENPDAWRDFTAALDEHAAGARARGICGHVFIHTHLTELVPAHRNRPIYARVAAAARARGLGVTESFPHLVGRDNQALWVNAFDVHPNQEGHAILAQALFEGLEKLPAACWRAHSGGAPALDSAGLSAPGSSR
jgi:lysophospholipase L1-like esterase